MVVVLLALFGLYEIWLGLSQVARPLQLGARLSGAWQAFAGTFAEHGSEWISTASTFAVGLATIFLWRSTDALSRSTNLQQSTDGPFLNVVLYPDGGFPGVPAPTLGNGAAINFTDYDAAYSAQDAGSPQLIAFAANLPAKYVNLIVYNRATKPASVAAKVTIKTIMYFGAQAVPNHPFVLRRDHTFSLIGPNSVDAAQLYNVAGLASYQIQISEVHYSDIMGRDRRAATGVGNITQNAGVTLSTLIKVFEPRKGEFTDANH